MDYKEGIIRLVEKIQDGKKLKVIYNFINRYYRSQG
jgi:hypothetical protein